ncbi:maltokinase N-terminal cap-like domain-containing protein [Streptomyces sediminimaris]|uniref:maltokinase N-terminal cap-like domain-containing protein n=1 Tax=Streptomyces sediminimaris TaxID=3383721 RepID=UPI0039998F2C
MSIIHRTTVRPTKLELLRTWLPARPWYHGSAEPDLAKAGGFRLDDPEGEVGIEFMVVGEAASGAYLVPLTYRGAPLEGAGHALVGTMEHGVLGPRWVYDGCHDPVLTAQLTALVEGRVQAQAQSVSDTPDREVGRCYTGEGPIGALGAPEDTTESTGFAVAGGLALRVHRVLTPAAADAPPQDTVGHVTGAWEQPDGTRTRGLFATLRAA